MQRGVIHYDELTECGLFKDAGGQIHVFRKGDPAYQYLWMDDTRGKPPVMPVALVEKPVVSRFGTRSAHSSKSRLSLLHWAGLALSGLALLLLINIGGESRKGGMGSNPKLIESIWAMAAGVLLVVELIYFSVDAARWRIRTNYWGIVVCTVFASLLMKGCDNYEADKVADVYTIVLAFLLLVVYLLPKRKPN